MTIVLCVAVDCSDAMRRHHSTWCSIVARDCSLCDDVFIRRWLFGIDDLHWDTLFYSGDVLNYSDLMTCRIIVLLSTIHSDLSVLLNLLMAICWCKFCSIALWKVSILLLTWFIDDTGMMEEYSDDCVPVRVRYLFCSVIPDGNASNGQCLMANENNLMLTKQAEATTWLTRNATLTW